ncbi:MAG: hypothetical protein KIT84_30730 [Labilithrix sp.]|nr:hypothetical protein [Labilithrix sp.]MCW5815443.1 hypothetical protein [Labilithrix sp.]
MRSIAILFATTVLATSACSKKDEGTAGAAGSASAASSTTAAAPAQLDPTLVEHVKAHVEKCTVNVEQGQAYSCKDKVTEAMAAYVREKKPEGFASTLIALVQKKDDEKTSAAAVALLSEQFDNLGEEGKRKNASAAVTTSALAMLKENAGNRATRLAPAVAQLATLSGSFDDLYAAVDAHPVKEARDNAYRNLLVFGRLKTLPKLKEVAEKKSEHAAAALDAPRKPMTKWTDEERGAICAWAKGYLADKSLTTASVAANDMILCKGEYIDALLAEAETRLKNKEFKDPFAIVMREPCFQIVQDLTAKAAGEAQCEAVYTFLEKVANDASAEDSVRGLALWNIYYQRRDEKTLKLMRKYEKHPNAEVAKRAKEAIASLTTTYKLKG